MRENNIPLYAFESGDPISEFDVVAFTLQYELCYSNVLNMLELGGIPLLAAERGENAPIVIGGGPAHTMPSLLRIFLMFLVRGGRGGASRVYTALYKVKV